MNPEQWRDVCVAVVPWTLRQLPDSLALPEFSGQDLGRSLKGVCGLGAAESGNCIASVSGATVEGSGSIVVTAGEQITFADAGTVMHVPLTIGNITVAGNWKAQQCCSSSRYAVPYPVIGQGSFQATISAADVIVTVNGLDSTARIAQSVGIAWADPDSPPNPALKTRTDSLAGAPDDAPRPNKFVLNAVLALSSMRLKGALANVMSGKRAFGANQRTLPGEILSIFNRGLKVMAG